MLGTQENEFEREMAWLDISSFREDNNQSFLPGFVHTPTFTPEINKIPGSATEFRPFGSVYKNFLEDKILREKVAKAQKEKKPLANLSIDNLILPPPKGSMIKGITPSIPSISASAFKKPLEVGKKDIFKDFSNEIVLFTKS